MSEVWDRLTGESSKAYYAFCIYRDLGRDRSHERVTQAYRKTASKNPKFNRPQQIHIWSIKYNWVSRVTAYDDYIEKKKREQNEKAILEMNKTHADVSMLMIAKVEAKVKSIDPETLTPADAAKWLDIASKLERVSRGEPSDKIDLDAKIRRFVVKVPEELEGE